MERKLGCSLRILFLLTLVPPLASAQSQQKWTFPEQDFVLTSKQQATLKAEALDGSPGAAKRLSLFYMNVVLDLEAGLYWTIIGAEDDDPIQQFEAYYLLNDRESAEDKRRAQFWLKKSASKGYAPAIEELKHTPLPISRPQG